MARRALGRDRAAGALVALPVIVIRPQSPESATVTVNGHHAPTAVATAELGTVIARVAERAGGPIRVEVHHSDGTVHADIVNPPLPRPARHQPPPTRPRAGSAAPVTADGFLPGEAVQVAVVVHTATADARGHLTTHLPPRNVRRGDGVLIALGVTSGTTTVYDQP